jgi:hypothetical protein
VLAKPYHLFQPRPARAFLYLPYGGIWGDGFFTAKNPPFGAVIQYWVREYSPDEVSIEIADAQRRIVRKLKGPAGPGFNRVTWDLKPEKEERLGEGGWGAQPELVPPGEYTVTMKVKGLEDQKAKLLVTALEGVGKSLLTP